MCHKANVEIFRYRLWDVVKFAFHNFRLVFGFEFTCLGIVLCLAIANETFGSASSVTKEYFLEEIIKESVERSYAIKARKLTFKDTVDEKKNSLANLLPTLEISSSRSAGSSEAMQYNEDLEKYQKAKTWSRSNSMSVSSSWKIWDHYSSIRSIESANLQLEIQKIGNKQTVNSHILEIINLYYDLQSLYSQKEISEGYLEQSKWAEKEAKFLVQAGVKTRLDILEAEIQVQNATLELKSLEIQIESKLRSLKLLTNLKNDIKIPKIDLTKDEPYFLDKFLQQWTSTLKNWDEEKNNSNPDVLTSKLNLDSSVLKLNQAKWNLYPKTSFGITQSWDLSGYANPSSEPYQKNYLTSTTFSLSMSWTIWDWWITSRSYHSTERGLRTSELQYEQSKRTKFFQVKNLIEQYEQLEKNMKISLLVLEKAKEQQEHAQVSFKMGKIIMMKVQQANLTYFSARNSHLNLLRDKILLAASILIETNNELLPNGTFVIWD